MKDKEIEIAEKITSDTLDLIEKHYLSMHHGKVIDVIISVVAGAAFEMCEDEDEVKEVITMAVNKGLLCHTIAEMKRGD